MTRSKVGRSGNGAMDSDQRLSDSWTSFESQFFSFELQEDTIVLKLLRTKLSEEDNLEQFGQQLTTVIDKLGAKKVRLSLGPLTYLTSAAIGKLIGLHRRMQRVGGTLVLADLTPEVREILDTSKLLTYFVCDA